MGLLSQDGEGTRRYEVDVDPVESSRILDFSILRVADDPSETWGTVRLSLDYVPIDATGLIIHHPGGRPLQVTRTDCSLESPSPIQRDPSILTEMSKTSRALTLDIGFNTSCAIRPGSSGAPYFPQPGSSVFGLMSGNAVPPRVLSRAIPLTTIAIASQIVRDLALLGTSAISDASGEIEFGDDIGLFAHDGECDDPRFFGAGMAEQFIDADEFVSIAEMHDATDCRDNLSADRIQFRDDPYGDDESTFAGNGSCDDPYFRPIEATSRTTVAPFEPRIYQLAAPQS